MKNLALISTALLLNVFAVNAGTEKTTNTTIANPNVTIENTNTASNGNVISVGSIVNEGYKETFIAVLSPNNDILWEETGNGGGHYGNKAVNATTDAEGNVYVTGNHSGTLISDHSTVTSNGVANMFVAKYNNQGELVWMTQAQGQERSNQVRGENVNVVNGQVVVTGPINGTALFGNTPVTGTGTYTATYDLNGNLLNASVNQ
jgi:hypothetical protein